MRDQTECSLSSKQEIMAEIIPHAKQQEALERNEYEILYGGARWGGKTFCGILFPVYHINKPQYRALVIRRNSVDLTDWIDRAREIYANLWAEYVGWEFRFPSWATIRLWHLKDENAYTKYQGHNYHNILIEELTHIPSEELYLKLISSCRSIDKDIPAQIFCTTNPWEIWHAWVKRRFIDVALPWEVYTDNTTGRSRIFIQSRVEDNPTLMENDPMYVKFLDWLPEDLRKAWREWSWDVFDTKWSYYSQYITEARKDWRISWGIYEKWLPIYKIRDLGIDDEMVITCCQFYGKEIRIIDCIYWNDFWLDYYIDVLKEKWYWLDKWYFPHDIEVREQTNWGRTRKEYLESMGCEVNVTPNMSIEDGINLVKMTFNKFWFDKTPWVEKLIEALNIYRKKWDDKNQVYGKPIHDWSSNFADSIRYLCVNYENIINEKKSTVERQTNAVNPITWMRIWQQSSREDYYKRLWIKVR